jgi:hypothetical protein
VEALDFIEHFTSCMHCYHSHYMSSSHDWHGEDFGEKNHDIYREIRLNRVHFAALHFYVVKPVLFNSLRAGQDLMRHAGGGPSHLLCAHPPKHHVALPPCSSMRSSLCLSKSSPARRHAQATTTRMRHSSSSAAAAPQRLCATTRIIASYLIFIKCI